MAIDSVLTQLDQPRPDQPIDERDGHQPPTLRRLAAQSLLLLIALAALFGAVGFWWGVRTQAPPTTGSAEAGFARDMATHHAQAVTLAVLLRDRSTDPEMQQLALDIMLTQQAQIGQMQGWLAAWGLPYASIEPAMSWMGMPTTDLMPGMASAAEINQLRDLSDVEADVLFLQLMIPHHLAGVEMAEGVLARSEQRPVRALAQAIANAQQSEITYMQRLLQQKGQPPVSIEPAMHHEGKPHDE